MTLDQVPFCYKEYPPVPEMECDGHKQRTRWWFLAPWIAVVIMILIGFIL